MDARQTAIQTVRAQQGLAGIPPADWSYAQRIAYNKALADYILQNPGSFGAQDMGTAAIVHSREYSTLEDTSFDWAMFGTDLRGNGVSIFDGFQLTLNKVLAIAAVLLALVWVFKSRPSRA